MQGVDARMKKEVSVKYLGQSRDRSAMSESSLQQNSNAIRVARRSSVLTRTARYVSSSWWRAASTSCSSVGKHSSEKSLRFTLQEDDWLSSDF